ncbi:MAG: hypothetical protein QXD89_00885 [Candidatus Aenigmatarchaeota archaeon]
MSIFKPYDIRGIYPNEINEEIFYKIARVCVEYFRGEKVLVGCDGRVSSLSLKKATIQGLVDEGVEAYDLNLVSTSTFNFLISKRKFDFGIQITASHNPAEYNGMKIYDKNGKTLGLGSGLEKIEELFKKLQWKEKKKGKIITAEYLKEKHKNFLMKNAVKIKQKFLVDFSNGVGSIVFIDVLKGIKQDFLYINEKIDGKFPSHPPEPNEQSLSKLSSLIKEKKLDFGIAFDGDADRIVFMDENGKLLRGDQILFILAKYLKPKKVVYEVSFPPVFKKLLEDMKIEGIETRVGRSFIIETMRKNKANLGGEISSHFYFKKTNYMEDAFYTFFLIAKILKKERKKISEILSEYKIGKSMNYKFPIDDSKKYILVEKLKSELRKKFKIIDIDGVKVIISKSDWFLIRASNTEPLIRIYIESLNEEKIKEYKKMIDNLIQKFTKI